MIIIQASGMEREDLTGTDWVRVIGKIAEHNAAGRIVTVSFGAEPKFLVRKHRYYSLKEVAPETFRKQLNSCPEEYCQSLFDEEAA